MIFIYIVFRHLEKKIKPRSSLKTCNTSFTILWLAYVTIVEVHFRSFQSSLQVLQPFCPQLV